MTTQSVVVTGAFGALGVAVASAFVARGARVALLDVQAFLVTDAVADFSAEEHRMALRYVATRCGHVIDTDTVTQGPPASHP